MEKVKEILMWVIAGLLAIVLIAPCLLTFSEGLDGGPTIWNLVGLAYTAILVGIVWFIRRSHAQRED